PPAVARTEPLTEPLDDVDGELVGNVAPARHLPHVAKPHGCLPFEGGLRYTEGDIVSGAQTERRGGARPGGGLLGGRDPTGRFSLCSSRTVFSNSPTSSFLSHPTTPQLPPGSVGVPRCSAGSCPSTRRPGRTTCGPLPFRPSASGPW